MTCLALPEVKMRSFEPLDFRNKAHRILLFDLAMEHQSHLLNDYDNDIILIINFYEALAAQGSLHAFVAMVEGKIAGCFWLEVDRYEIGRVHGAMLPEYRSTWSGLYFMRQLVAFAFEELGLRKLDSEFAMYSKRDKQSAAYERILKRIGFTFRSKIPQSLMINGQPKDTILLDYLKGDYDSDKA